MKTFDNTQRYVRRYNMGRERALYTVLGIFFLIVICTGCSPVIHSGKIEKEFQYIVDPHKFENVYNAGKSLEEVTEGNISYRDFKELLQNFAQEISVAQERVKTEEEKEILKLYSEAHTIFQDSAVLWKYSLYGTYKPHQEGVNVKEEVKPILAKYNIPAHRSTGVSGYVIPKYSITVILSKAIEKFYEAYNSTKEIKKIREK